MTLNVVCSRIKYNLSAQLGFSTYMTLFFQWCMALLPLGTFCHTAHHRLPIITAVHFPQKSHSEFCYLLNTVFTSLYSLKDIF